MLDILAGVGVVALAVAVFVGLIVLLGERSARLTEQQADTLRQECRPAGGLGKLRVYHCDCGGRVAVPVGMAPFAPPICSACSRSVIRPGLRVTIEDRARFMEEVWGESR